MNGLAFILGFSLALVYERIYPTPPPTPWGVWAAVATMTGVAVLLLIGVRS
jgi:hypothetical protein